MNKLYSLFYYENTKRKRATINYSSDIYFINIFLKIYKNCTATPYCFKVNNTNLPSDNPLCFRRNLLKRIKRVIMTINKKIKYEKLQYDINRDAAKISASLSGKIDIDKYEFLIDNEILSSDQLQTLEQAKFTYTPLRNTFNEQTKTIEEHREKQIKAF